MTSEQFRMRFAGLCGPAAFVAFSLGLVLGDLAQPSPFSPAHDDISYLGALTAKSPWLYDQLAANTSGILLVALAFGLWWALSPNRLGRLGAATLVATGVGMFLDGIFRLDCQSINAGCSNDSWHSHAHKLESGFTAGLTLASILLLAFAFRRIPAWRNSWLPTLAAIPAIFLANLAFAPLGSGAATRAGTIVVLGAFALLGFRLRRHALHQERSQLETADEPQAIGPDPSFSTVRSPGPVFRNDA